MSITKVSTKGAVVIPKEIRKKYGIEPGMKVNITETDGNIRIIPIPKDPLTFARGLLKKEGKSLTDILLEERKRDLDIEEVRIRRRT
ncbi:MAG: AbrB/MazE/SpoVT family DNA-binding domain-containing protein [bacterium]